MSQTWRNPVDEYNARVRAARQAEAELDAAVKEVRGFAPDFLRDVDLPQQDGLLPDDRTAAVSFCLTERGSIGFVLTRGGPESGPQMVHLPDFTTEDLKELLFGGSAAGWTAAARQIHENRDNWLREFDRVLATLGERLVKPILAVVPERIERLIVLPTGGLYLLPLHAAPLDGQRRVCDRWIVSYGPSAGVLALLQKKARAAEPTFYAAAATHVSRQKPLPFAEWESRAVAELFPDPVLDLGSAAQRRAACERSVGRAYVHFACHGRYDWDDPAESGLELTDGRLRLADLLDGRLDLSAARLVTLSACEAGVSDVVSGSAEEYVGLPAGFLMAGVPCVLSSLWAVDDLAGTMLVERFYRNHRAAGMDFPTALAAAQGWLRSVRPAKVAAYAERAYRAAAPPEQPDFLRVWRHYRRKAETNPDAPPFAHPHFWAVFTINGW